MTAFATADDVQARAEEVTLTDDQMTRATAFLDDVAALIRNAAPATAADSELAKVISCQAVLRALSVAPGIRSKAVGSVNWTYAGKDGTGVYITDTEVADLQKAALGSDSPGGSFSIIPGRRPVCVPPVSP